MSHVVRIAGIVKESIVDGPGIRMAVFTQGCLHNCPSCHNPHTHPLDGGSLKEIDEMVTLIKSNPLLDGITLSGGEPFLQAQSCAELARRAKEMGLHVMTYTGYTFEELLAGLGTKEGWKALLESTDVLVDGRFQMENRDISLRFRGSSNQRIIDVPPSLACGAPVILPLR